MLVSLSISNNTFFFKWTLWLKSLLLIIKIVKWLMRQPRQCCTRIFDMMWVSCHWWVSLEAPKCLSDISSLTPFGSSAGEQGWAGVSSCGGWGLRPKRLLPPLHIYLPFSFDGKTTSLVRTQQQWKKRVFKCSQKDALRSPLCLRTLGDISCLSTIMVCQLPSFRCRHFIFLTMQ